MSLNRSILVTTLTGASGAGGTLIYQYAVPGTGTEVLIKEGYYFLDSDNEYKAITNDHKDVIEKNKEFLKINDSKDSDTYTKIKEGCKTQLLATYARDFKHHTNITNLCTHNGIITVKGRLMAIGQNSFIEDEADSQKYYDIAFGIYRYHNRFIKGINKFNKSKEVKDEIKANTGIPTGRLGIKSACETELIRFHREIENLDYFQDISGGCQKYKYEKIKELIISKDPSGELDTEATGKAKKGEHTQKIKERLQGGNIEGSGAKVSKFDDLKIKNGCNSNHNSSLEHNDSYQENYLIVRYVCKKETNSD